MQVGFGPDAQGVSEPGGVPLLWTARQLPAPAATVLPYKLCGNLDTGVPNRVHQSFTAREYINYKQIRPLVLVEQHGDQRDTMEEHLLLQPGSPSSSGQAAGEPLAFVPSVTRHSPPVVLRNQYGAEITYCYLDHLLFCPLMNYGSPHNIKSTISIAFANH